jgi:septum formation protein
MKLVLASGSPRRRELLRTLRDAFEVDPADVHERDPARHEDPTAYARELALHKLRAVAPRHPDAVILAADTVVYGAGSILNKPKDEKDALDMLRLLSGVEHQVITAVAASCGGQEQVSSLSSMVRMRPAVEAELRSYVSTGEGMDKAGSYAIQGHGAALISGVEGCMENVVGFPLCEVSALLAKCGISPPLDRPSCTHLKFGEGWNPALAAKYATA